MGTENRTWWCWMARVAICSPSEERGNANLIYEVYMRNTTNNLIYWVVMHRRERAGVGRR